MEEQKYPQDEEKNEYRYISASTFRHRGWMKLLRD